MPSSTNKQLRYFQVTPLTNIPLNRGFFFTYGSLNYIPKGSLVEIPLGRKKVQGIVLEETGIPNFGGLKNISSVLVEEALNDVQIELAHHISNYYLSALGLCLKLFVPKIIGTSRVKDTEIIIEKNLPPNLSTDQSTVLEKYNVALARGMYQYLLFGPTGSGKTEVYMAMIHRAINEGGQALLLVPEISLVPQNINRFRNRFFDKKIALLHSKLSGGERYLEWQKIRSGEVDIVIGPRSALFVPFEDLRIIVIDEEHDQSFKQYDQNPRYNSIELSRHLSSQLKIPLILGSATPEVEDYCKAQSGEVVLLELSSRIYQNKMPEVEVIDMKEEFKKKNFSIFSESLHEEMEIVMESKKQIILFINRRGAASFVTCRTCGYVAECSECSLPFTYHIFGKNSGLLCHHCGKKQKPPEACPECNSSAIKFLGGGTEKVYAALHTLFPEARIARMDKDTTMRKGSHERIFTQFKNHEIDILVGTQMISKGWDLPKVDLVGIVSGDVGLHFPDFRASERTFQLLTQVAGRTGRKHSRGKVVLQTYYPNHEVIEAVKTHDFRLFYGEEIKARKDLGYPPFSKLIKLIIESKNENTGLKKAEKLLKTIEKDFVSKDIPVEFLGPAPSFFSGVGGVFNVHIVLKFDGKNEVILKEIIKTIGSEWKIDVDPLSLL